MMDIQTGYPESPMETDDSSYPCKGCGQILEEGKAFELAGHRWHIDCFRCNTCGTLLDSDANLLLLGDGSLICNNCTYSCSACGNKIEDLAILTGDQAYCAGCFRCRNCKKKIENLRYARTSQGMFCMDCHDALMARRRKKSTKGSSSSRSKSGALLDKSLPSLPRSAAPQSALSPDQETLSDSYSESTLIELPGSTPTLRNGGSAPSSCPPILMCTDNLGAPSTYRQRHSGISQRSELEDTDNGFFIPMALDPNPAPGPSPLRQPKFELDGSGSIRRSDSQNDYFAVRSGASSRQGSLAHINSGDHSRAQSPHVAVHEQGWEHSQETPLSSRLRGDSMAKDKKPAEAARATTDQADFQLQEAPKRKKSVGSKQETKVEPMEAKQEAKDRLSPTGPTALREQHVNITSNQQSPQPSSLSVPNPASPRLSTDSRSDENALAAAKSETPSHPKRGDSLQKSAASTIPRKEVGSRTASGGLTRDAGTEKSTPLSNKTENEPKRSLDFPPRSRDRPTANYMNSEPLTSPLASAQMSPDNQSKHQTKSSVSSMRSENLKVEPGSPSLKRHSKLGEDEDGSKSLGQDDNDSSFLRRVSKSVRHARSHSDRANRTSKDGKWVKGGLNGASPLFEDSPSQLAPSPEGRDDLTWLRSELRKERERNAEAANMHVELTALKSQLAEEISKTARLSEKNAELEGLVEGKTSIKQVNSELREKRSTMVVLDTQKEIVVRELEILTDHIAAHKQSKGPLDFSNLTSAVLREFASSLQKLKDSYTPLIEELTEKKIILQDEITKLSVSREKAQEEFRQLSQKNVQLMELNNSMVSQGQPMDNRSHGLGIYTHHHKDKSNVSIDSRELRPSLGESHYSGTTMSNEHDPEGATILHAPRVVNIRKEQPKKTFNWKKGGNVAKGMTKGLKGAFSSSESRTPRELSITEGMPYGAMPQNGDLPITGMSRGQPDQRPGFGGLFGQPKKVQHGKAYGNGAISLDEQPLHPSNLEMRAEYERVNIPSIVTRCIQEVELRGMDQEGIYRKSGGAAQIQVIRDGFVQSNDYDISDPDLDINAVTSCLKQYFRKLPTPLITFDVYDLMLESIGSSSDMEKIQGMRAAVLELPSHHRDCLEFLVFHLARVIEREKENLMTAMNCAVVFAPTIMRPESITREMTDTAAKNTAVQFIIENCHAVFLGEQGGA